MFDSSIFKKFKLNRNDMKKILRKFPRYRYSYLDNDFENKKLLEVPMIHLSCELCRKYVSTIVTKSPFNDTLLYERYRQFQVICYDCYYKKLEPKNNYSKNFAEYLLNRPAIIFTVNELSEKDKKLERKEDKDEEKDNLFNILGV